MQALIDFDGWRKWKDFSASNDANQDGEKGNGGGNGGGERKSSGKKIRGGGKSKSSRREQRLSAGREQLEAKRQETILEQEESSV